MRNKTLFTMLGVAALALALSPLAHAAESAKIPANPTLEQAVNGHWRTPAFAKRD